MRNILKFIPLSLVTILPIITTISCGNNSHKSSQKDEDDFNKMVESWKSNQKSHGDGINNPDEDGYDIRDRLGPMDYSDYGGGIERD